VRPATLRAAGADGAGSLSGRAASVAVSGQGQWPSGQGAAGFVAQPRMRRAAQRANAGAVARLATRRAPAASRGLK